ncbi:MAG: ABC transporter permease [Deltaproteobacteria bacterium]|nr:ABC transporter permease [Deltaproteobacteria bacterium]
MVDDTKPNTEVQLDQPEGNALIFRLKGGWKLGRDMPSMDVLQKKLESRPGLQRLFFDSKELTGWDSGLLTFLIKVKNLCAQINIRFDGQGLPEGVRRLLDLATAVPEKKDARKESLKESFLSQVGAETLDFLKTAGEMLSFIGEASLAFMKLFAGKARYRRSDFSLTIQQCGAQALPIVSLISLLVGMILAFIGAVQLQLFGAEIYVANLVGIAMIRVMGAIMTGIIMAGRTGAAFAAQLGTMETNEEIDALKTLGISPMEFLVLPRMLALMLMMPLLGLYADLMGVLGGLIVGVGMLDISIVQYFNQTREAIGLTHLWIGLFHSIVFGVLVALAGCLRGIQCGRSASAVGDATTSAVVTGIVSIIVTTALITVLCNVLGI